MATGQDPEHAALLQPHREAAVTPCEPQDKRSADAAWTPSEAISARVGHFRRTGPAPRPSPRRRKWAGWLAGCSPARLSNVTVRRRRRLQHGAAASADAGRSVTSPGGRVTSSGGGRQRAAPYSRRRWQSEPEGDRRGRGRLVATDCCCWTAGLQRVSVRFPGWRNHRMLSVYRNAADS